jgi:hypothetical protein
MIISTITFPHHFLSGPYFTLLSLMFTHGGMERTDVQSVHYRTLCCMCMWFMGWKIFLALEIISHMTVYRLGIRSCVPGITFSLDPRAIVFMRIRRHRYGWVWLTAKGRSGWESGGSKVGHEGQPKRFSQPFMIDLFSRLYFGREEFLVSFLSPPLG